MCRCRLGFPSFLNLSRRNRVFLVTEKGEGGETENRFRSGVDLCPSSARDREVMPVGLQVLDIGLKGSSSFVKIWRMPTFGLIASVSGSFLSTRFMTGGPSFLEITFMFPLSTAPSAQVFSK